MKIALGPAGPKSPEDLLAILVTEEDLARDTCVGAVDKAMAGALRAATRTEEFSAKKDTVLTLHSAGLLGSRKVALVGLGAEKSLTDNDVRAAAARAAKWANQEKARSLAIALPPGASGTRLRAAAEGVTLGAYRFTRYLTGDRLPKKSLEAVTLALHDEDPKPALRAKTSKTTRSARTTKGATETREIERGVALAEAICLVRDLVNEPPNELTPAALARVAQDTARAHKLPCKVFDMKAIRAEGMKLLEAVGRGSANEPRLVHVTYVPAKPRKNRKRVVVVGKGLTFDSGGLCIKPPQGMGEMKSDMAGAALSVGLIAAVGALRPDVEVHAIFAAAENMPDGNAYRPGDIFGSLDGKTVEIINTDAEGRLVLADALTYARSLEPDVLVDHATLTGACVIALGTSTAGLYANDDALADAYLAAAREAGESMWRMPLLEDLRESLKSDVADLKHTGDRFGGSISAALFLREFVGDRKWIHLDIAGPAMLDRTTALGPKGGTGFGLSTLVRYLETLAHGE